MQKLISFFIFCSLLIQVSCSTFVERLPAQIDSELFNQTFSIPLTETGITNYSSVIKTNLDNYVQDSNLDSNSANPISKYELLPSKNLPKETAFHIEMDIDVKSSQMIYRIFYSPSALKDEVASAAMMNFVIKLMNKDNLETKQAYFEMYYNAKNGDPIALDSFLKLRQGTPVDMSGVAGEIFQKEKYTNHQKIIEQYRKTLATEIKQLKAKRSKDKIKRKSAMDALDKAPESKQLRTLIAKGDRAGTGALLKKYLPWEEMAPFEKGFWENYIDIITNPVPLEQRVLIYRGIDDDYIHKAMVNGKELTEKEAIIEGKAFVMSSVMVKNQGSWNRRLRSLEAMNDKFIGTINRSDEYAQVARISTMFLNHSTTPQGSPFLSFSPNFNVAEDFGAQRVSAYLIDPRLLNFNYTSFFENEIEFLIPLSTFPDEMVAIADVELLPENFSADREKYINHQLEKLIVAKYGESKKNEVVQKIKKNSYHFFRREFTEMKDVPGKNPGASNLTFYKKFLGADDPKPALSPKGELTCKDLIELFWVAN